MTEGLKRVPASVVTVDGELMHGTPCFAGTRVPVQTLIDFLETGETIDEFVAVYPAIPREQVFAFLELSRDRELLRRSRTIGHRRFSILVRQLDCDVFITAGRRFEHQQDLRSLSFGIVMVHVARNKIAFYRPLFPRLFIPCGRGYDEKYDKDARSNLRKRCSSAAGAAFFAGKSAGDADGEGAVGRSNGRRGRR